MFFKNLYTIGDRFEDKARARLSHVPFVYAALGGTGIILFWRGIWHTFDYLVGHFFAVQDETVNASIIGLPWWDGPLSILLGSTLLVSIGLFVTSFIGDTIIISGLRSGKKLTEKTEREIRAELKETDQIRMEIHAIHKRIQYFERLISVWANENGTKRHLKTRKRIKRKTTLPVSE